MQAGVDHFRKEIQTSFLYAQIFLFDPNVDTWFVNKDLKVTYDQDMAESDPSFYPICSPIGLVREHIKQQFTQTLYEEQLRKKVSILHNRMNTSYTELKRNVCKSIDEDQIVESEYKMVEEMKKVQKEH